MKPALSANINKVAPYKVVLVDINSYRFITDWGLVYEAGFVDDSTFMDENAYQFYLKELTGSSGPKDIKVMKTIGAIIEEFFFQNDSVVVYICDDSDGKQAVRNRIFINWFESFEHKDDYTLLTGQGKILNDSYYAAILLAKKNPDYEEIINAFSFFKMELRAKFPDADIE